MSKHKIRVLESLVLGPGKWGLGPGLSHKGEVTQCVTTDFFKIINMAVVG